jgi:hypothetical protein
MSKKVADLLPGLPLRLHDSFLKLVEHDFWNFQYACRHFQMHYKASVGIDISDTEIRNYPYFQSTIKLLKNKIEWLKAMDEPENIIACEVGKTICAFQKVVPNLSDEVAAAFKAVLFNGKWPPRKKLKNSFFTDNRMDLLPPILEELATQKCGVSSVAFEKITACELTSEEWEQKESIQRFCTDIRKRTDDATLRHNFEMSLFDMETSYEEQQNIRLLLDIDKRNVGDEDTNINNLLFHACNDFGGGYYICDLFRSADFGKMFTFDEGANDGDTYSEELKSSLISGAFWQPLPYESAFVWILDWVIRRDKLEPYIAISSNILKHFSELEYFASPMWESDGKDVILIFVNCNKSVDSAAELQDKILKLEKAIRFEIDRLKKLDARLRKHEFEKDDLIIYSDDVFKVVLNPTDFQGENVPNLGFYMAIDFTNQGFNLKKTVNRLRFLYIAHIYIQYGKMDFDLIDDATPVVKDFKFGTMTRPVGLWIWDEIHTGMRKISEVLKEAESFFSLTNADAPYKLAYLQEIYEHAHKCILGKNFLSMRRQN